MLCYIYLLSPLSLTAVCLAVCMLQRVSRYGGWGGGHEPGGLEGEVYSPGGPAHEVQSADYQDPRTHR